MSHSMDAMAVEAAAYRERWNDGLFDLFVGISLLWIGASWLWLEDVAAFAGILPAILVTPFVAHRTKFVESRAGYVRFSRQRRTWERRNLMMLLVFGVGLFVGGVGMYFAATSEGRLSDALDWALPGLIAWLVAIPVLVGAVASMLPRLWVYTGTLVMAGLGAAVFDANPGMPLLVTGTVVTVWGGVLLVRFIRSHPAHLTAADTTAG